MIPSRPCRPAAGGVLLLACFFICQDLEQAEAFLCPLSLRPSSLPSFAASQSTSCRHMSSSSSFYEDFESFDNGEDDDGDDDYMIDPDSLGDWRDFRRNLAQSVSASNEEGEERRDPSVVSVSKENEAVLSSQNKDLAEEYKSGVWAHETSTPEVGGLVVRMPIEVELHRNHRHSIVGRKLKKKYGSVVDEDDATTWYKKARSLVEDEMQEIASTADDSGQIDSTILSDESTEMLQIFLDNQETWQEVSLIVERDEELGTAKALVLNRPMAFKLTENLSRLVLNGQFQDPGMPPERTAAAVKKDLIKFMLAFGQECAIYVGGTDDQDEPATMIHGIKDIAGAREISPGTGIYEGGLEAAIDGVLQGKYNPLDFRFFVGCHKYEESSLDVSVVLGKYQPVACARALALKQCISLPKPLWHEVLELCGGSMQEVSALELLKRDDILFQVIDEDEDDYYDD